MSGIQGRPRENKLTYLIKALCFVPIPIFAGVYLAKYFPLKNLIQNFDSIDWLDGVLHPERNEYTGGVVMLCLLIYVFFAWQIYSPDNKHSNPYGSAKWGKWQVLVKKYATVENEGYKEAIKKLKTRLIARSSPKAIRDMEPVASTNRILSEHCRFNIDVHSSRMNANSLGVGSAGSAKTTSLVYTNIMQNGGSLVVCDPKCDVTPRTAGFAEAAGYKVKILDLADMDNSDRFNPFAYVNDDKDIISMVSFCFKGMDTDKSGAAKDPFWDDANMLEIAAVCYLLYYDARPEDRTLSMAMKLVNLNSLTISRGPVKKTGLSWLFYDFEQKHGSNNMPMTYFQMFDKAKDKTLSNIETTLAAKMQMLLQPKVERLMSVDDLNLGDLGRNKEILFLKVPDADDSFNFIISMCYMFLYKELYKVSDVEYHGNGCKFPVTILQDEFTSFPQPNNYLSILSGCRSRNIGLFPIFQDIARLKNMKCLGEGWSSIFGQVDSWVFLGSQEPETCKFISEQLGKETIEVINKGSNTHIGRELATADELMAMDKGHCIVKFTGEPPIYDTKYPFLKHPNIKLTAIPRDKSGIPLYTRNNKEIVGAKKIQVVAAEEKTAVAAE